MTNYLQDLNDRIAQGVAQLPESLRRRQAQYFAGKQNPDGGFSGREGESDLYYTGFALRGLAVLDALTPESVRAGDCLFARLFDEAGECRRFLLVPICVRVDASERRHGRAGGQLRRLADARRRYVRCFSHESLERLEGGFLGGVWDEDTDVEYTFYGLGSLAVLWRD